MNTRELYICNKAHRCSREEKAGHHCPHKHLHEQIGHFCEEEKCDGNDNKLTKCITGKTLSVYMKNHFEFFL